jgi:hypothetical protein
MKKAPDSSVKENNDTFGMGTMGVSFGYPNPSPNPA